MVVAADSAPGTLASLAGRTNASAATVTLSASLLRQTIKTGKRDSMGRRIIRRPFFSPYFWPLFKPDFGWSGTIPGGTATANAFLLLLLYARFYSDPLPARICHDA